MPYNTKNRYEQGQALRKEIYMYIVSYISVILNWLDMHRRLQRFLKGWMPGELRSGSISIIWLMMVCSRRTTPVPTGHILQLGTE